MGEYPIIDELGPCYETTCIEKYTTQLAYLHKLAEIQQYSKFIQKFEPIIPHFWMNFEDRSVFLVNGNTENWKRFKQKLPVGTASPAYP